MAKGEGTGSWLRRNRASLLVLLIALLIVGVILYFALSQAEPSSVGLWLPAQI